MNNVNWSMIQAITGCVSLAMAGIGVVVVLTSRWVFVTKKEFNEKLSNKEGITFFVLRKEYEKERIEIRKKIDEIVPRSEWERSKAYRERRIDESQRVVCGKIDKVTESITEMGKEQAQANKSLNLLTGRFETYLELIQKKQEA